MSATERKGVVDRLVELIPRTYRHEANRLAQQMWDRLPPVAILHRLDALERHVDRRIRELESKVDALARASKAA
jgi:hypothetical protein